MRRMPIDEDIPLSLLPVFRAASDRYCTPVEADQSHYRRLHADYRRSRYKFSTAMERAVKTPLKPGRGLMDWVRLCQQNPNMGGNDGVPIRVTDADMAEHAEQENAWMIINGKVYNVAPYMEYHPGGIEQLMRAAGTDGTKLFNEKHPWVNYESMLKACLVGHFVGSSARLKPPAKEPLSLTKLTLGAPLGAASSSGFLNLPKPIEYPRTLAALGLTCTWKEDGDNVQLVVDTEWKELTEEQVLVECMKRKKLRVLLRAIDPAVVIVWALPFAIDPASVKAGTSAVTPGRFSISFQKEDSAIMWPEFLHESAVRLLESRKYRKCRIRKLEPVTHDTRLFTVDLPDGDALPVPVGSHVFLRMSGVERPYTPVASSILSPPNGISSTSVHLLIKVYSEGALTPQLWDLEEGNMVDMSDHQGSFNLTKFSGHDHIFLLAAGTGFTPMARVIQHCLHKLQKNVTLLFFNKTEGDILWREDQQTLSEQFERFRVVNVLSEADDDWQGRKGRVSIELLSEFLLPKSDSYFVCVCGPPGFVESSLLCLKELQYGDNQVHVFQG